MQNKVYGVEFKAAIVAEYIRGENGYKVLAHKYGVPRDTIRSWVLSKSCYKNKAPALTMTDKEKRELDYYKTAAIFWENYAKNWTIIPENRQRVGFFMRIFCIHTIIGKLLL